MYMQLVEVSEAFHTASLPLKESLWSAACSSIESYQKTNMDTLKLSLAFEDWQPVSSDISVNSMKQSLSTLSLQPADQSGVAKDFDTHVQAGNPFKVKSHLRAVGGESQVGWTSVCLDWYYHSAV